MADATDYALAVASPFIASSVDMKKYEKQLDLQRGYAHEMMAAQYNYNQLDRQDQRADTEYYWNTYNSPAAIRAAYEDAGVSPDSAFSSGGSGSGASIASSVGGVSTPSVPSAPEGSDPVGIYMDNVAAAHQAAKAQLETQELERASKYNQEAQEYELQVLASRARQEQAAAVLEEKEAGTYDARREEEIRSRNDAHERHLSDLEQQQHSNLLGILDYFRNKADSESRRKAEEAAAEDTQFRTDYAKKNGHYPGAGPSLVGTLLDALFPNHGTGAIAEAKEDLSNHIEVKKENIRTKIKDLFRSRSEKDARDQGLMRIAYEHGDKNITYDPRTNRYSKIR